MAAQDAHISIGIATRAKSGNADITGNTAAKNCPRSKLGAVSHNYQILAEKPAQTNHLARAGVYL